MEAVAIYIETLLCWLMSNRGLSRKKERKKERKGRREGKKVGKLRKERKIGNFFLVVCVIFHAVNIPTTSKFKLPICRVGKRCSQL